MADLSLKKSFSKDDLYRQFLMHSHKVYYDLSARSELPRLVDNIQTVMLSW